MEGLIKSDGTIRGTNGKRVFFLFFGTPDHGKHGGNTAAGTWNVLKIVNAAVLDKSNKDGGWTEALKVTIKNCICMYLMYRIFYSVHEYILCT